MKLITLLILNLLIFSSSFGQVKLEEGLFFSAHEVIQDRRTSLTLTPERPIPFNNNFKIEFESNFRKRDGLYGSIFRIIANKELNIDLVANLGDGPKPNSQNFWLVIDNDIVISFKWKDIPNGGADRWTKFRIDIDAVKSTISLSINGIKKTKNIYQSKTIKDLDIVFGKSDIKNFVTTDVCPMSLKNIKLYNDNKLIRNWILGKHLKNNNVYDEINTDLAVAKNPTWLLDQHLYWKISDKFSFSNYLGSAKDIKGKRLFFIDQKAVYVYHLQNKVIDTITYKNKPFQCLGSSFIYNEYTDELWSYAFDKNLINKFNFKSLSWSNISADCMETSYWHHVKMISPLDLSLLTFGGYGNYEYKNAFQKFDSQTSVWTKTKNEGKISPRYVSSSGIFSKHKFLIFGGFGSKSGSQVANSRYYYDLYSVDFNGNKVQKLWKKDNVDTSPFVPVEEMVVDAKANSFYSLIYDNNNYNTTLKLARFGISEYKMTLFPDSIPYKFLDVKSNASFFLNPTNSSLYAVTSVEGSIKIYTLSFPPLLPSEVFQNEEISIKSYLLTILAILIVIAGLFIYKGKMKKNTKVQVKDGNPEIEDDAKDLLDVQSEIKSKKVSSAIYLFGGFEVYDKEGNDITSMFTPTLKQLFLLILLSKSKNEKGITSFKMIEYLWYDKSESSARNNKNVNISKLKLILEKIGNVELVGENNYWSINLGEKVFCDYTYVTKVLDQIKNNLKDKVSISNFLDIVSVGEFCPDIQSEWMEMYKVDISNRLIDGLDLLSKNQKDPGVLEVIANIILKYDPLNEEAIVIKCRSLYATGKKVLAKQSYDDFCRDYKALLDAEFSISFKDIVSS
jgi:two-component SAPR family response regulator